MDFRTRRRTQTSLWDSAFSPVILLNRPWLALAETTATKVGMQPWLRSRLLTFWNSSSQPEMSNSGAAPSREELGIFRRGRARALQALYAWDLRPREDLGQVAVRVWDDLAVTAEERKFANHLMRKVIAELPALDSQIGELTTNWRLERIGVIERSVLRLGAAELAQGQTPPRVAIQEAVRLAERFGSARSAKFVNGVLDAYARQIGAI